MRPRRRAALTAWARIELGSGSLLAVAIVGGTVAFFALCVPLYIGLGVRQSVDSAADSSALAGADVAAGIFPGSPCAVAGEIARENRASVRGCTVDGLVVTVRASSDFAGLTLSSTATAGPPVVGTN
jgi:secretion/DNA translocation related TadE-like protein